MRKPTQQELTDPEWAYFYAEDVIKGRFVQGEPIIATDPYWAYYYAHDIVEDRFELGEPVIATSTYWAYMYVRVMLKYDSKYIDFYNLCFQNGTLSIHDLPQHLQDNEDIQVAYFKIKVLT
jgi:hypothetical protein